MDLRRLLIGFRGPRTRRQGRVSGTTRSITRPSPPRPRLSHPLALLLMGLVFSAVLTAALAQGQFERLTAEGVAGFSPLRVIAGTVILVGVLNGLFSLYLLNFRREVLRSRARVMLTLVLAVIVLVLARYSARVPTWPAYLIPLTLVTVVLSVVFDRRFALECSWMLLLYVGAFLVTGSALSGAEVIRTLVVLGSGMLVAALSTGRIRTRVKIIQVGLLIGVVQLLVVAGFGLIGGPGQSSGELLQALFWALAHGILIGFVVSGSLPLVEYLFGISTDISLLELSNIAQQTVLRRLLVAAPGTYNHSFIVGMLAEEAAEAIGANPLLARVGGYYHDIGKMLKPEYYGENEVMPGLHHRDLAPTLSTLIIKAHVKDGAELARHHDLPRPIIDIIEQHHGTTLVEYFYGEALKRAKKRERVEESTFRYEGPKPRTREAGIVMLADSVEASTRSLSDPTPARIESSIRSISTRKLADGQFDECGITLKEVRLIEDSFIRVLAGIFHRRPRYPDIVRPRGRPAPEDREAEVRSS